LDIILIIKENCYTGTQIQQESYVMDSFWELREKKIRVLFFIAYIIEKVIFNIIKTIYIITKKFVQFDNFAVIIFLNNRNYCP